MNVLPYPLTVSEADRLNVLDDYKILDTPQTDDFDRLVNLAARLFNVPIALISLVDRDRQFFKARVGLDICETSRDVSFCAHAIVSDEILFVPDALCDPRFASNPLVIGAPFIRFYAGKPLVAPTGEKVGTLCLIDTVPHAAFSDEDRLNLTDLAALVMERMETRRLDHIRTISQARFENIAATSPDAIVCSNTDGRVTFWNRSAERLFGYSARDIANRPFATIVADSWRHIYVAEIERLRQGEQLAFADQSIVLSGVRKDGGEFPAEVSLSTWKEGDTTSVGAIVRDITERRLNEARLYRMASRDALTDLHNRGAWRKALVDTLAAQRPATVLLLDLDRFKEVNDTLGHSAGDAVLKAVAARLAATCTSAIKLGRLGGDEFVALLHGDDPRQASIVAAQLVAAISAPYEFAGQWIEIGVCIGVSLAPAHGHNAEELLGAADLALYRAKGEGRGRYELFTPAFREVAVARRAFELELRQAFERGEFELFFQAQVATETQQLLGAEALMRWHHPKRGLLTPASFIDVLSDEPSATDVGEWTLRTACLHAVAWRKLQPDFRISVNLFEAQLRSARILSVVQNVLNETGLPAHALELEIVENTLLRDDAATLALLRGLRAMGVGLAFDDYGTGFASLRLLKRYPVSRLKIDRAFIRHVNADREDAAVVNAIIYLGTSFGLEVIAEGVETQAQLDFLIENRCLQAQGYLFGRAVPAAEFSATFFGTADPQADSHRLI